MKKTYKKPELLVENFILSEYIAACNATNVTFGSSTPTCGSPDDSWSEADSLIWSMDLFDAGLSCLVSVDGSEWEGTFCKHNPEGSYVLIGS